MFPAHFHGQGLFFYVALSKNFSPMARIAFSSTMEEINGKLSGSVFQDSYGGFQIRTRVSPRNPQSYFQQLRRGEFGYISASWRFLSSPDAASWVAAAGTVPAGKRLFISSNINLTLIFENPITAFVPGPAVPDFALIIDQFELGILSVEAVGPLFIVPAGYSLLVFATAEKVPPKNFTNPSMYSPVTYFPAGSDLTSPVDIAADWIARFGQFTAVKRICIKCCLIDITNGTRGNEFFSCAISPFLAVNQIIDAAGDTLIDFDGTIISFP